STEERSHGPLSDQGPETVRRRAVPSAEANTNLTNDPWMTTGVGTYGTSVLVLGTRAEQKDRCHCGETGTRQNQPAPSRSQVEVDTVNESVARIEAIIGRKVKRDIDQMTEWAKGNLARAAEAIMNTPNAHRSEERRVGKECRARR